MGDKAVGDVLAVQRYLEDTISNVWCMKEPDYTIEILETASGLTNSDDQNHHHHGSENGQKKSTSFKYHEPFYLHFNYRHIIDDHNNLRHAVPSVEETWVTTCWALCVLQFLMAIMDINMYLCMRCFVWDENENMALLEFRRARTWELINNLDMIEIEETRL